MYYYYPESSEAYDMKEQYMFGDDLLVTAVVKPVDKVTGVAERTIWFPEGKWYDMVSGALIEGNQTLSLNYTVAENPYYARAGAIIPMNPSTVKSLQEKCNTLVLTFIPGADGSLSLYEDDGVSKNYAEQYATTQIVKSSTESGIRVVISPRQGAYNGALAERKYELRFPAQMPAKSVKVNGKTIPYARYAKEGQWGYDGYSLSPIVYTDLCDCNKECVVEIEFDAELLHHQPRLYGKQGIFNRCVVLTPEFKESYAVSYDPYPLLPDEYMNVSQAPNFIMEYPTRIVEWLDRYEKSFEICIPALEKSGNVDAEFISKLKAQFK
jgi:alpha-glucosidase